MIQSSVDSSMAFTLVIGSSVLAADQDKTIVRYFKNNSTPPSRPRKNSDHKGRHSSIDTHYIVHILLPSSFFNIIRDIMNVNANDGIDY